MAHDDMAFYSFQIDIARALKKLKIRDCGKMA
jgi:hypothetical protein